MSVKEMSQSEFFQGVERLYPNGLKGLRADVWRRLNRKGAHDKLERYMAIMAFQSMRDNELGGE